VGRALLLAFDSRSYLVLSTFVLPHGHLQICGHHEFSLTQETWYPFCNGFLSFTQKQFMSSAPFWDVMQRVVVYPYRRFGRIYGFHLNSKNFLPMKSGQIRCPETSARNYCFKLRNIPVGRRFHLLRSGSLKSHIKFSFSI